MPKRGSDADSRIFFDELVSVATSRLRATDVIRIEDRQAVIPFGDQTKLIGVAHTNFPNVLCTRGPNFPISRLESRLMCPSCGNRQVTVMFEPPMNSQVLGQ
jgi:hypothetical protein